MTADLPVPAEAVDALMRVVGAESFYDSAEEKRDDVGAIAAPVVAAELRRVVVELDKTHLLGSYIRRAILRRADELDARVVDPTENTSGER